MEQKPVRIDLNNTVTNFKIENIQSPQSETNQKCSKLTKILIGLAILLVVIAFIFILLFAILKVQDDDDDDDNRIPVIFDVDEGADDMIAYIVANNSKKYAVNLLDIYKNLFKSKIIFLIYLI